MDFEIFKLKAKILSKEDGKKLRDSYIETFINTNDDSYQTQINLKHNFSDGYCYLGYLWDYIKNATVIEENYIEEVLNSIDEIYVFWDIHTCERIFIENYWRFDKDAVLKLNLKTLLLGKEYLPEDIYIFDDSFEWTLIRTHEDVEGKCFCLKSGRI